MNAQKIKKNKWESRICLEQMWQEKKNKKDSYHQGAKTDKTKAKKKKQSKILGLSLNSMLLEQHKKEADLFQTIDNRLQLAFTC